MTDGNKLQLIRELQANASRFFESFYARHGRHMQCSLGCSKCCREGLTVFPVEAQSIFGWFEELSPKEKLDLGLSWSALDEERENGTGCVFLRGNACSIYQVRPLVCRVQGLPLLLKRAGDFDDLIENDVELSLCELNFQDSTALPDQGEWLNLDRLNTLLAIAQRQTDAANFSDEILSLSSNEEGRVHLSDLRALLLRKTMGTGR